jgi:hypothetical protein
MLWNAEDEDGGRTRDSRLMQLLWQHSFVAKGSPILPNAAVFTNLAQ